MKRIYIYLLSAIVSLAFAPAVSAQTDYSIKGVIGDLTFQNTSDVYTVTNNVGVRKQVSTPVDGKYWIKLEAFATGEASIITNSTPSDILLVLDVSTSMTKNKYGSVTRLAALKTAAKAFIGNIYDNAVAAKAADINYDGNRVGIVSFGGQVTDVTEEWKDVQSNVTKTGTEYSGTLIDYINNLSTGNNGTWTSSGLRVAIDNYLDGSPNSKRADANLTVVVFTDGEPATAGSGNLTIDGYSVPTTQGYFSSYIANNAVYYSNQLKQTYGAKVFTVALLGSSPDDRVEPFVELLSSNYPNANAADPATNATAANYSTPQRVWTYNSTSGTVSATGLSYGNKNTDGIEYYQKVGESDLTSIFEAIAGQSGGSANSSLTSATTAVDIVSESFLLPNGTVAGDIKVFTANCNYADADTKTYRFDPEILAPHSDDKYRIYTSTTQFTEHDVDNNIVATPDVGNNTIKVTGFDYSHNWCGPVTSSSGTTYQGHKIIIMIPIEANPDAVGGPSVKTNTAGSGIYVNSGDSSPLIEFDYPTISLPVNIYIEKSGLKNGESAKFIIEKAVMPASGNPANVAADGWSYVTSVFVTKPQNAVATDPDPVVKIKGLPATEIEGTGSSAVQKALLYRIREENWSWSYTFSTDPQYTVSEKVENPFVFTNTPKTNIDIRVRHAESKATNIFKPKTEGSTSGDVKYDDSKTNVRP